MTGRLCLTTSCNNCRFCLSQGDQPAMSAATHTVSTDALATLGTIIDETAGRDAIHLAVEPVRAGGTLYAGQHVSLANGIATAGGTTVGIVDPFLRGPVFPDQMFWLVVYPRQITSLRHVWEHPAFPPSDAVVITGEPETDSKATSEAWMRQYAEEIDEGYNTLLDAATAYLDSGQYFYGARTGDYFGKFESERTHPDFWHHYQIITGRVVPSEDQGSFFTCAC
jgi:hypothetical protein